MSILAHKFLFRDNTGGQCQILTPKVNMKEEAGVHVIDTRGEFVVGKETDNVRDTPTKEAEEGTDRLLIDLANVTYLNPSALGVLISAHTNLSKRGAMLGLCNVSDGITNIFVITKLSLVFNVYGNREEGMAALSKSPSNNGGKGVIPHKRSIK